LEKKLYGEDSVKLGKTYKIIGTLYIIREDYEKAREYLSMAYKIFESKGMTKLMAEIEQKLKLLGSQKTFTGAELEGQQDKPTLTIKSIKGKKKKGKKKTALYS